MFVRSSDTTWLLLATATHFDEPEGHKSKKKSQMSLGFLCLPRSSPEQFIPQWIRLSRMPPYCLTWTSCHLNTEGLKWIINQNTKQGISWDLASFSADVFGFSVGPGESSEAADAEAPGLFDDHLNHRAAHFEASQLKFNTRDFTFNKNDNNGAKAGLPSCNQRGGALKRGREELRWGER